MNHAAVIEGPFSSTHNGANNYSQLHNSPSYHSKQGEMMEQPSAVLQQQEQQQQQQQINSGTNIHRQFSSEAALKDPRTNIIVGSKLFVGQVPSMTTEEQLYPVFEPYGTLLEIKIMRDRMGRSKGSAWVRYATDEMARNAIVALHEKHTVPPQTNPLRVQFASPSIPRNQQHNKYFRDPMGMPHRYNYGGPVGGGNVQPNGMMSRSGNNQGYVVPPMSTGNGRRYMSQSVASHIESPSMMAGPYTSSVNRFDTNAENPTRDFSYSFADRSPGVPPVQYQQQRNFISPSPSQHNYSTQQEGMRNNGGGAFDGIMGTSPGSNMELDITASIDRVL